MDRPLRAVPAEDYDEVVRLAAFRRAHPEVVVDGGGRERWRARMPHPGGEVVVSRYELRDLLDELGRLLGASQPDDPG